MRRSLVFGLICLVLLGAAALRVVGIGYGLPLRCIEDEPFSVNSARRMATTGDLRPARLIYPTFQIYMLAAAYKLLEWTAPAVETLAGIGYSIYDTTPSFLVARFLTALLGVLTVLALYLAGRELYGAAVGLFAAAFLAFSPMHVGYSHSATTDLPMGFWTTLSFLFTAKYWKRGMFRHFALAAFSAGIAFSTKYHCALILIPLGAAWLFRTIEEKRFNFRIAYAVLLFLAGFLLFTPYVLIDFPVLVSGFRKIYGHYAGYGHPGYSGSNNWLYYLKSFADMGILSLLASFAGIAFLLRKFSRESLVVLSFPVIFFIFVSSFKVSFARNLIPVLPFLALFAAIAVDAVSGRLSSKFFKFRGGYALPAAALMILCLRFPALCSLDTTVSYTRTDTRASVGKWMDKNLPPATFFAYEKFPPNFNWSLFLSRSIGFAYQYPPEYYRTEGFDYLLMNSFAYRRFFDRPEENAGPIETYERLWKSPVLHLLKEFEPERLSPGPAIKIFEVTETKRFHEGEGKLALESLRFDEGLRPDAQGEVELAKEQWIGQKLILAPGRYVVEADLSAQSDTGSWPIVQVLLDGNPERLDADSESWKRTVLGFATIEKRRPCWFYLKCAGYEGLKIPEAGRYRIRLRELAVRKIGDEPRPR
jgi:hypothetical protein